MGSPFEEDQEVKGQDIIEKLAGELVIGQMESLGIEIRPKT